VLKGFMPPIVQFVNMWRVFMRPALGFVRDFFWAAAHNYTLFHYKKAAAEGNDLEEGRRLVSSVVPQKAATAYQSI
jgi:hypothetical protein